MKNDACSDMIKALANAAKERLREGAYSRQKFGSKSIYEINRRSLRMIKGSYMAEYKLSKISSDEDDKLYQKVCKMLSSSDLTTNPIAQLYSCDEIENLSRVQRERYIMNLSEKYVEFKNKFENELLQTI